MSLDGYIDDTTPDRLRLSDETDFDRVDQVRAGSDAILIGATTARRDNPRLIVKSGQRQAERQARGLPACPLKVIVTASGDLDPALRIFHSPGARLVYCPDAAAGKLRDALADLADVVPLGAQVDFGVMLDDLGGCGVRQLMVEGGSEIHTRFLTAGLADEIQLAVAPFFVGDPAAPRFVGPGAFPDSPARRMRLAETRIVGDMALLRYLPDRQRSSLCLRSRVPTRAMPRQVLDRRGIVLFLQPGRRVPAWPRATIQFEVRYPPPSPRRCLLSRCRTCSS